MTILEIINSCVFLKNENQFQKWTKKVGLDQVEILSVDRTRYTETPIRIRYKAVVVDPVLWRAPSPGTPSSGTEASGTEAADEKCPHCREFFARYRCNSPDECDCPKCQGMCTCHQIHR